MAETTLPRSVTTMGKDARMSPPAYALVDKATKLIRMHDVTQCLAIFDTRQAARNARLVHPNTMVVPIRMERVKRTSSV